MEILPTNPIRYDIQSLISQGIERGIDVQSLERLLAMAQTIKAEYAREEFNRAFSLFQSKCPIIEKTEEARDKNNILMYKYALLESIVVQVGPLIQECGFNYYFATKLYKVEEYVEATCYVEHVLGHVKSSTYPSPFIRHTNMMSESQVVSGTFTVAKRMAFCNAFGILTFESDVDTRKEMTVYATQEQINDILELIERRGFNIDKALKTLKVNDLTELTTKRAASLIAQLQDQINKRSKGVNHATESV